MIFAFLLLIFLGIPSLVLLFGALLLNLSRPRSGRIVTAVGALLLLAGIASLAVVMRTMGPGHSGFVAQGTSPDGKEYCIVQTWKDWGEPYQVSFYIRDADGVWRWNYLAHQDIAWRSAQVEFDQGTAFVFRNGNLFREMALPSDTVELAAILPGYRHHFCPPTYSAEDVFAFHTAQFVTQRKE